MAKVITFQDLLDAGYKKDKEGDSAWKEINPGGISNTFKMGVSQVQFDVSFCLMFPDGSKLAVGVGSIEEFEDWVQKITCFDLPY